MKFWKLQKNTDEQTELKPFTPAQQRARQKQRERRNAALLRAGIQLCFFVGMPGMFVAAFSGLKQIATLIGKGEPLQVSGFVQTLIALCLLTVMFGRFFCGFVCAFGSFGDAVFAVSGLVQTKLLRRKKQYRLPVQLTERLQIVKYLVLALILLLCGVGVYSKLRGISPWDVFAQLTVLKVTGFCLGWILLLLIIVGMAVQPRFFCQILCPLGAVFALLPTPFGLRRNAPNCIKGCNACKMNCPVSVKLNDADGRDGECIACEKCVGICPRENITRWDVRRARLRKFAPLIKALLFAAVGIRLGLSRF